MVGQPELELNCGVVAKLKDPRHARHVRSNLRRLATAMTPRDIRRGAMLFDACANVHADVSIDHDSRNVLAELTKGHCRFLHVRLSTDLMLW